MKDFDFSPYKKSGWRPKLYLTSDGDLRFIIFVSTGRKESCLITRIPDFNLGYNDPALKDLKESLRFYTFPTVDRFKKELEIVLSALYNIDIQLDKI